MNLRSFRQKLLRNKSRLRRFLTRLEKDPPAGLHRMAVLADAETWAEIECLNCGNCCRTMTPTFTTADVKRISTHLSMTPAAFREKWLYKDKEGDWMNHKRPWQFFNKTDNKCSIYAVRPSDCAGFPHLTKKKKTDYIHVYKQNVEYCPATQRWVEHLEKMIKTPLRG
jgi:uncharacterized protein